MDRIRKGKTRRQILNQFSKVRLTTDVLDQEYPLTPLNILDLVLTLFCVVTLLLVFLNPCGSGSKSEEVLDTILLVVRNGVQFWRLLAILRR